MKTTRWAVPLSVIGFLALFSASLYVGGVPGAVSGGAGHSVSPARSPPALPRSGVVPDGQASAQHAPPSVSAGATGDRTIDRFRRDYSILGGADEVQVDLWGPVALLESTGNDTLFWIELFVNETTSNRYLNIIAHTFYGNNMVSTRPFALTDDCWNASVWATQFTGSGWNITVAGSHFTTFDVAFLMILAFDGTTFSVDDAEIDLDSEGDATYITDMRTADIDDDGSEEIVMCGYAVNSSSYDAILWIYNVTDGLFGEEVTGRWPGGNAEPAKLAALDVGNVDGVALDELFLVGCQEVSSVISARSDVFFGASYDPNAANIRPDASIVEPVAGRWYDIVVADVDNDAVTEIIRVGQIENYGVFDIINLTGSEATVLFNTFFDSSAYYEVAVHDFDADSVYEIIIYGKIHEDDTSSDHMRGEALRWDGSTLVRIWEYLSPIEYDLVDHHAEIMIGDGDGDGVEELWIGASCVDGSAVRQRNKTIWNVLIDVEQAPEAGRFDAPDPVDHPPEGRYPDHLDVSEEEPERIQTLAEYVADNWHYAVFTGISGLLLLAAYVARGFVASLGGTPVPVGYLLVGMAAALFGFVIYSDLFWQYPQDWLVNRIEWVAWYLFHDIYAFIP